MINEAKNQDRALLSSDDPVERTSREADVVGLVDGIVGRHEAFFSDPANRLDFLATTSSNDFLRIARFVNAKLRGEKPHQMRYEQESGGSLPALRTPPQDDKPEAFKTGYQEIQGYISSSDDSIEEKIEGVAMAVEALVVWVHPFNDGNGRTSRFLAKLIEDGLSDKQGLVDQTVDRGNRRRVYKEKTNATKGRILEQMRMWERAKSGEFTDFYVPDEEEQRRRIKQLDTAPDDIEAIRLGIKNLLENQDVRRRTKK